MSKVCLLCACLLLLAGLSTPASSETQIGQRSHRYALVIGNSAYRFASSLPNGVNDANAISRVFKRRASTSPLDWIPTHQRSGNSSENSGETCGRVTSRFFTSPDTGSKRTGRTTYCPLTPPFNVRPTWLWRLSACKTSSPP